MPYYIYVVKLSCQRFYVGLTTDRHYCLSDFNPECSEWTKKYKPKKIRYIIECEENDLDAYTRIFMYKYNMDYVRGGSYDQIILPPETSKELKAPTNGHCFACRQKGHYASKCQTYEYPESETESDSDSEEKIVWHCVRCGRNGHDSYGCIEEYHVTTGRYLI